jgi:outer membrane protein TolC
LASAPSSAAPSPLVDPLAPPTGGGAKPESASPIPPPPTVEDPLLLPIAPARRMISSWDEVAAILKARSVDLHNAYNAVRQAEGVWRVALAQALTSINVNGSAIHQFISGAATTGAGTTVVQTGTTDVLQGSIVATQPLINAATWQNVGTQRLNAEIAKTNVEDVKRTITGNVAQAIVAVVVAERVAEVNRVGLRSSLERLALTVRRQELGTVTALDVARAQQDVEAARATLITGDESLRQSREALGIAIGYPEQTGVAPDVKLDGIAKTAGDHCKKIVGLESRPDLAVLRGRAQAAGRTVDLVKLQFLPTFNAVSQVATTATNVGGIFQTTWNIQGVLSIPLWDGGTRYGNLRQNQANTDIALENLESARRQAVIQVVQANRAIVVAENALQVATAARDAAAEVDRLTRVSYQEGRGTSLELVAAAATLRQNELNLAQRELDLVRAKILAVVALAKCDW